MSNLRLIPKPEPFDQHAETEAALLESKVAEKRMAHLRPAGWSARIVPLYPIKGGVPEPLSDSARTKASRVSQIILSLQIHNVTANGGELGT